MKIPKIPKMRDVPVNPKPPADPASMPVESYGGVTYHVPGQQAGVAYVEHESTPREGYAYLTADGRRLGGIYRTPEGAQTHGPAFAAIQKRR